MERYAARASSRPVHPPHQRVDLKPPATERLDHAHLRIGRQPAGLAPGIGKKAERPRRRNSRILLPERAGGGVARIDVKRAPSLGLLLVEAKEIGLFEIDLATHLEHLRRAFRQALRDVLDGADVGRHVLTGDAIAPRGAEDQGALLIAERHREAVYLRLSRQHESLAGLPPEEAVDLLQEIADILFVESVLERKHGHGVAHDREAPGRRGAHPLARRIRSLQLGKPDLDGEIAQPQRVVFGVGDERRVVLIVAPVMLGDLARQALQFASCLLGGQRLQRLFGKRGIRHFSLAADIVGPE